MTKWGLAGPWTWHWLNGARSRLAAVWHFYGITVDPSSGDIVHSLVLYLIDRGGYERTAYLYPFLPGVRAARPGPARRDGGVRTDDAPGLALRLTALAAAGAALLAVVSGTLGGGTPHTVLAALALPPLLALVVAAAVAHRRLLAPAVVSLVLFLAAALLTGRAAQSRSRRSRSRRPWCWRRSTFRGGSVPRGSLRDYVTLTKPRIMSLLLVTGACGMVVGARGMPAPGAARVDAARSRARLRRSERAQPRPRPRHRPADGPAHGGPSGRGGPHDRAARARVRARALGLLVRRCSARR